MLDLEFLILIFNLFFIEWIVMEILFLDEVCCSVLLIKLVNICFILFLLNINFFLVREIF